MTYGRSRTPSKPRWTGRIQPAARAAAPGRGLPPIRTEDDRLLTGTYFILGEDRDRMIPIPTRDFLAGLEQAQRINSAEGVYRPAGDADRLASRRAALAADHERARAAVESLLRSRREDRTPER